MGRHGGVPGGDKVPDDFLHYVVDLLIQVMLIIRGGWNLKFSKSLTQRNPKTKQELLTTVVALHFYLFQGDEPLQVNHVVGLQDSLRAEPTAEHHQQAGEHAQQPDVDQQVEEYQPRQQNAKTQPSLLSQHLGHDTVEVTDGLGKLGMRSGDHL